MSTSTQFDESTLPGVHPFGMVARQPARRHARELPPPPQSASYAGDSAPAESPEEVDSLTQEELNAASGLYNLVLRYFLNLFGEALSSS